MKVDLDKKYSEGLRSLQLMGGLNGLKARKASTIVVEIDGADRLYFVVETNSGMFTDDLHTREDHKIKCGVAPFVDLGKTHPNPARFKKSTDKMEF